MVTILFIDDDIFAHNTLKMVLPKEYSVVSAYTGKDGIEAIKSSNPQVVLLDINLPDEDGIRVLDKIQAVPSPPSVIMLSAERDIKTVIAAIKKGAYDYVVKPYKLKELEGSIRRAVESMSMRKYFDRETVSPELDNILGLSRGIKTVRELILKYRNSDSTVLITGKSGTGKELVARTLHAVSPRAPNPFVAVNCGALPESIIEAELFGSERGAFTDSRTRAGLFEQANTGTIFLDEIGEMPLSTQVKLLRILEEKEVRRVGGSKSIPLNIHIIAATNRDLKERTAKGFFREDLYYRIGVLPIAIPLLSQRSEDIILLASFFIKKITDKTSTDFKHLSEEARNKLLHYPWPGNIRELKNVIERALLLSTTAEIQAENIRF